MKVKLTAVYHNDKNKDGVPFMSKDGKPYSRCNIKTAQYGDRYLSGFSNATNKSWSAGDDVDIEVEEKGQYLNFKTTNVATQSVDVMAIKTEMQQQFQALRADLKVIADHLGVEKPQETVAGTNIPYPDGPVDNFTAAENGTNDLQEEDVPFN